MHHNCNWLIIGFSELLKNLKHLEVPLRFLGGLACPTLYFTFAVLSASLFLTGEHQVLVEAHAIQCCIEDVTPKLRKLNEYR